MAISVCGTGVHNFSLSGVAKGLRKQLLDMWYRLGVSNVSSWAYTRPHRPQAEAADCSMAVNHPMDESCQVAH